MRPACCCGMYMFPMLLAECVVCMKLISSHVHLLNMQVRYGTWQGIPAVYKVWDLGDSLEPLLDMQDELDAYHALRPRPSPSGKCISKRLTTWPTQVQAPLVEHISLFLHW